MQDDIEVRLRAFEGSDALGNGDFTVCAEAADTLASLRAEVERLHSLAKANNALARHNDAARKKARIAALEEAAGVAIEHADQCEDTTIGRYINGTARDIEAAIRALIAKEG